MNEKAIDRHIEGNSVFRRLALGFWNSVQWEDLGGMHNGRSQSRLLGVIKKNGIEHLPDSWIQTKADVGYTEQDAATRKTLCDELDSFQGPQPQLPVVFIAGADGEGQWIEEQVSRIQAMRKDEKLEYTARIHVSVTGDDAIAAAIDAHGEAIAAETLAASLEMVAVLPAGGARATADLDGHPLALRLVVAG